MQKQDKVLLPVYLSFFLAIAVSISLAEFFLPRPIPYIKPGFANIPILMVIYLYGAPSGVMISISKSFFSSIILGYFLSAPFYLSLGGSLSSSIIMGVLHSKFNDFSFYSISIWGALTHSITQLIIIFTFLIKSSIIFINIFPIILLAIITGFVNGYFCSYLLKVLDVYKRRNNT